jgi:hypothetical protein
MREECVPDSREQLDVVPDLCEGNAHRLPVEVEADLIAAAVELTTHDICKCCQ